MKYFIVNNNYHIFDIKNHEKDLSKIRLLVIPHTIDFEILRKLNYDFILINTPFVKGLKFLNVFEIYKTKKNIDNISFNSNDDLYLYAEEEWLSHYIVQNCYKKGLSIYLLEDGGMPNYIKLALQNDGTTTLRSKIKLLLITLLWGFKYSHYLSIKRISYPQIDDYIFSGFFCYFDVEVSRKIKKILINRSVDKIEALNKRIGIFLNEDIYNYYTDIYTYIKELNRILSRLNNKFDILYFKFHPREGNEIRKRIEKIIHLNNSVQIITDDRPIEEMFAVYKPGFLISFHSAALLNGLFSGIQPIYIYNLCDSIKNHQTSQLITFVLESMNYNFLESIEDFNKNYNCGIFIND